MRLTLLVVLALAACSEAQTGARPPAASTAAAPSATGTGSPHANPPPGTQAGTPPLSAGKASQPFERAGADPACTPETLRARLQGIVDKCREASTSICGKVTVKASEDGGGVAVAVDLGTTTGATAFVACVTAQVNAVHWECTEPGKDLEVDLGCEL